MIGESKVLDRPLHEAVTMLKFYHLSGEFQSVKSTARSWVAGEQAGKDGERGSKLGRGTTKAQARPSASNAQDLDASLAGGPGGKGSLMHDERGDFKRLFLKWCRSMERAPNQEVRRFWFQKLETLAGGPDILKRILQESQWKRLSRNPPPEIRNADLSSDERRLKDWRRKAREHLSEQELRHLQRHTFADAERGPRSEPETPREE
jgi:hypothetical protein